MFVNVKTFFFDSLVHAQAVQLLDAIEQDKTISSKMAIPTKATM